MINIDKTSLWADQCDFYVLSVDDTLHVVYHNSFFLSNSVNSVGFSLKKCLEKLPVMQSEWYDVIVPIIKEVFTLGHYNSRMFTTEDGNGENALFFSAFKEENIPYVTCLLKTSHAGKSIFKGDLNDDVIFYRSMDAMLLIEREGRITRVNQATCELFEASAEQICRHGLEILNFEDQKSKLEYAHFKESLSKSRYNIIFDLSFKSKNNVTKVTELKLSRLNDEQFLAVARDVTYQKNVDSILLDVNEQLSLAVESSNVATWIYSIADNYNKTNEQWARQIGFEPQEITPTYDFFMERMHADDRQRAEEEISKTIKGATDQFSVQFRMKHREGHYIWLLSRGKVINWDDQGAATCLAGTHVDITEQKTIENQLSISEERYKRVVENLPLIFWTADAEGVFNFFNSYGLQYFNKKDVESIRKTLKENLHPDDVDSTMKEWKLANSNMLPYQHIHRLRRYDGNYRWFKARATPIFKNGKLSGWIGFTRDIHEGYLAQQRLEETEHHFDLLTSNIDEIIWLRSKNEYLMLTSEYNDSSFGKIAKRILGFEDNVIIPTEYGDQRLMELCHPDDLQELTSKFSEFETAKKPMEVTFRIIYNDSIYWLWNRNFYIGEGSDVSLGVIKDVTEMKIKEDELIETNHQLDNFVYRVSHDLRAPLASSLGLTQIMKQAVDMNDIMNYIDLQIQSLSKMDRFIHDILDYSRNSRREIEHEIINLEEKIDSIIEEFAHTSMYYEVTIKKDFKAFATLRSDPIRLIIILKNLIDNAFKYQDPSKSENLIIIKTHLDNGSSLIEVSENGIGIDEKFHEHLFKMFYRANDRISGSGIGLYIANETAKRLNGRIEFTSKLGEGSSFRLILPDSYKSEH